VRARPAFSLQLSEPEPESDDEVALKPHATTTSAVEEEDANVEDSGESGHTQPTGSVAAKGKQVAAEDSTDGSSSSESSSYLMSTSNPAEVTETLGMMIPRLIGGQIIGKLRFENGQRERDYLAEAGDSFCFPLMERRLMMTGSGHALRCDEDLALKAYVAARCASR